MNRANRHTIDLPITIDRALPETLDAQIARQIRQAVEQGILKPGDHLPPIRHFAKYIGVSRATLNAAYDALTGEGLIDATPGRGSFIAQTAPRSMVSHLAPERFAEPAGEKSINAGAALCEQALETFTPSKRAPLAVVTVSDAMSPEKEFRTIASRIIKNLTPYMTYTSPQGLSALREQICAVGERLRGLKADPDQVIVTSGSQMGFFLAAQLLFNRGDSVWMEDPGYPILRDLVRFMGISPVGVPVDSEGLVVEQGIALAPEAKGCFITPSHQCPLGMLMSLQRRRELLSWANRSGAWIIEDDYDSELRFDGNLPHPCLQGMDAGGNNVIYVGTFSKMIFPGYRLGYLVLPKPLVKSFSGLRLLTDRQGNEGLQAIVAEYIRQGAYEQHIRKMRRGFELRRAVLLQTVKEELSEWGEIVSADQGMHVVFRFHNPEIDDTAVERALQREGVEVRAVSPMYVGEPGCKALMLGFGFFERDQILAAVRRIGFVLRSAFAGFSKH